VSRAAGAPGPVELEAELGTLRGYLAARGWLAPGEQALAVGPAGEGNMNRTLRVRTDRRSLIVKQSRPYVVRYPEIPAPAERLLVELRFYAIAGRDAELARWMPAVLAVDEPNRVALLEDLGEASDLTRLYARDARLAPDDLETLCRFAARLHALALGADEREALRNEAMRRLNHEHVFALPLDPANGLDLDAITPGLAAAARALQEDDAFRRRIAALGERYLADPWDTSEGGPAALLHGDFYPGSFLDTAAGLRIIDPEFAFPGPPEFDLGVLGAHLVLAGEEPGVLDRIAGAYARPVDRALLAGFAAAELVRRLLGVAQLPLPADTSLETKQRWLALARHWADA